MKTTGFVQIYTPRAKQDIRQILLRYLEPKKVEHFTDHILTCLDELIKNGIKANYKFLYIRERLQEFLSVQRSDHPSMEEILSDPRLLSDFTEKHIETDDIMDKVRKVLNDEAIAIRYKTNASRENRMYTEEERKTILGFNELRRLKDLAELYNIRLQVNIHEDQEILIVDIINTAPIMQFDIEKIKVHRRQFREYADRGEEALFFVQNLDESGGGSGLGYGTIDAALLAMGLEPEDAMRIISTTNTTVILAIEIRKLGEMAVSG